MPSKPSGGLEWALSAAWSIGWYQGLAKAMKRLAEEVDKASAEGR